MAEIGGAGGRVKAGLKENSSQTIFTSGLRSVNTNQITSPPPQLDKSTPKIK